MRSSPALGGLLALRIASLLDLLAQLAGTLADIGDAQMGISTEHQLAVVAGPVLQPRNAFARVTDAGVANHECGRPRKVETF
jgi:hypothetical protein